MQKRIVYNKKMLAAHWGISTTNFKLPPESHVSSREVKKEFGKYRGKCFTPKQLRIIAEELGIEV